MTAYPDQAGAAPADDYGPLDWVRDVRDRDRRAEDLRRALSMLADDRARIVAAAAAAYGRGGRERVAAELGVTVGVVDVAIKRARTGQPTNGLPWAGDLLERLYRLELADIEPLPASLWQCLAAALAGTFVDTSWIEDAGHMIAGEVDDDADQGEHTARLAAAARAWTRTQALAVLDAIHRHDLAALPTLSA